MESGAGILLQCVAACCSVLLQPRVFMYPHGVTELTANNVGVRVCVSVCACVFLRVRLRGVSVK